MTPRDGEAILSAPNETNRHMSSSRFMLKKDKCIDDLRPFKVVVIGAGFSGITCAIRFAGSFLEE